jgi:hypothetical protein
MSQAVQEDGIVISQALTQFDLRTYEQRAVSWGGHQFPHNLYATDTQTADLKVMDAYNANERFVKTYPDDKEQ